MTYYAIQERTDHKVIVCCLDSEDRDYIVNHGLACIASPEGMIAPGFDHIQIAKPHHEAGRYRCSQHFDSPCFDLSDEAITGIFDHYTVHVGKIRGTRTFFCIAFVDASQTIADVLRRVSDFTFPTELLDGDDDEEAEKGLPSKSFIAPGTASIPAKNQPAPKPSFFDRLNPSSN